jgi:hypothetical protein
MGNAGYYAPAASAGMNTPQSISNSAGNMMGYAAPAAYASTAAYPPQQQIQPPFQQQAQQQPQQPSQAGQQQANPFDLLY